MTLTRPLFEGPAWRRARRILDEPGCRVLIALDLDGTIAPFRPRPDRARVPRRTLRSLSRGARSEAVRIAILSARPLKDMKRLVPVRNVLLLGQYGLEGPVGPPAEALRGRRAIHGSVKPIHGDAGFQLLGCSDEFLQPVLAVLNVFLHVIDHYHHLLVAVADLLAKVVLQVIDLIDRPL